jgi:colanic acid/amylovoran biosynthesis glycosyltransferase
MTGPRPLRIAYLTIGPKRYSETFIDSEIRAVREAGATVGVFTAERGHGKLAALRQVGGALLRRPVRCVAGIRVAGFSYLPYALLAGAWTARLTPALRAFAPDVIHAHFVNLPTATAVALGDALGVPVTATAHAADFLLEADIEPLRRRLARLGMLFVISQASVGQLTARGIPMSRIPHTVVRAAYDGVLSGPRRDRANPGGPTRLVTVARLVGKKGVGTALAAVARLAAAGHRLRYDVYGDGPLRGRLTRQARELGLTGVVTFHGAVPHPVATAALDAADIAVLPCRRDDDGDLDGIPVFLMEAGGRGVPVVTTGVSGIPELVAPDAGWLVPPEDPVALAAAVAAIITGPVEARQRADRLRERIGTEFTPARQAERLLAGWGRLTHGSGRTAKRYDGDA